MSQPIAPPPPPPSGPPPVNARQQVEGPAIGLIVTAALGVLLALFSLLSNLVGFGMSGLSEFQEYDRYVGIMSGGVGILLALFGLAVSGFVIWAALEMRKLQNRTLAVVASVLAMVPCISPCCLLGIPIGIWSLVVLMKPEVQQAFVS